METRSPVSAISWEACSVVIHVGESWRWKEKGPRCGGKDAHRRPGPRVRPWR
jgi:hypothetical protein